MSQGEDFEVIRGSDNVFRDLGLPDADTEQMKSALAAEIIKTLREQGLTHAAAAERGRGAAGGHLANLGSTSTASRSPGWCAS